ncbi:MAG: biotin transporter BioY [Actinomycetia bacterium]|nr:biotin transporter BioY [Actinomycetes bacterium]
MVAGRSKRIQSLAMAGLGIALMAAAAQIQVPIGPVPVTLQTLVLFVILLVFTPAEMLLCVLGYLVLGAVGLPIGAGFRGGLAWLIGPTGGFLFGFLAAAVLVVILRQAFSGSSGFFPKSLAWDVAVGLLAMAVYYVCGAFWLAHSANMALPAALTVSVLPFVVPDAVKLAAAISCAQALRLACGRAGWRRKPRAEGDDSVER